MAAFEAPTGLLRDAQSAIPRRFGSGRSGLCARPRNLDVGGRDGRHRSGAQLAGRRSRTPRSHAYRTPSGGVSEAHWRAGQFSVPLTLQSSEDSPFENISTWMQDNLRRDLRVESLAERVGMSPRTFARVSAKDRPHPRQGGRRTSRRGRPQGAGRIRCSHQGNRGARRISKRRAFAPRFPSAAERAAAGLSGAFLPGAEGVSRGADS